MNFKIFKMSELEDDNISIELEPELIDLNQDDNSKYQTSEFKLITITMECKLQKGLNPAIIFHGIDLNDQIIGIKYLNQIKGSMTCINSLTNQAYSYAVKKHREKTVQKNAIKLPKKFAHGDFRNQVTLNVLTPGKSINTKVFSNGTIIFTGCKNVEQANYAKEIFLKAILNLSVSLNYQIEIPNEGVKRLWKSKISKQINLLKKINTYHDSTMEFNLSIHKILNMINSIYNQAEIKALNRDQVIVNHLTEILDTDNLERNTLYYYLQVIQILKLYYLPSELNVLNLDLCPIVKLLKPENMNLTTGTITDISKAVFPVYIDTLYDCSCNVVMIYHMFSCNYLLNREVLIQMLKGQPRILYTDYDNIKTSGAKIQYLDSNTNQVIKIVFYYSGKVNIISKSFQASNNAYHYVLSFLQEHQKDVEIKEENPDSTDSTDSTNKSIPDFIPLGVKNNQNYVLLKKSLVLQNPRNLKILKDLKLLDMYLSSFK